MPRAHRPRQPGGQPPPDPAFGQLAQPRLGMPVKRRAASRLGPSRRSSQRSRGYSSPSPALGQGGDLRWRRGAPPARYSRGPSWRVARETARPIDLGRPVQQRDHVAGGEDRRPPGAPRRARSCRRPRHDGTAARTGSPVSGCRAELVQLDRLAERRGGRQERGDEDLQVRQAVRPPAWPDGRGTGRWRPAATAGSAGYRQLAPARRRFDCGLAGGPGRQVGPPAAVPALEVQLAQSLPADPVAAARLTRQRWFGCCRRQRAPGRRRRPASVRAARVRPPVEMARAQAPAARRPLAAARPGIHVPPKTGSAAAKVSTLGRGTPGARQRPAAPAAPAAACRGRARSQPGTSRPREPARRLQRPAGVLGGQVTIDLLTSWPPRNARGPATPPRSAPGRAASWLPPSDGTSAGRTRSRCAGAAAVPGHRPPGRPSPGRAARRTGSRTRSRSPASPYSACR